MIVFLWSVLFSIFAGSYIVYFSYLRMNVSKPWKLNIQPDFSPKITVLVPAYNEAKTIGKKLENLAEVTYPKEKMEVFVIDDASTDETLAKARDFANSHPELPLKILQQTQRIGKANALNRSLESCSNELVVVTDADSFWPADVLRRSLPYMSDPTVGAVTGRGMSIPNTSWVTKAEEGYIDVISLLRLGESKIYSTIRFEGAFCIFRRSAFDQFDNESGADDSGTALKVVQNGFRTILVPEAHAFLEYPRGLKQRTKVKTRRAVHLTGLWLHCFKLLFNGHLVLPKRIAVPEIFISLFDPMIFFALLIATFILVTFYPLALVPLIIVFCLVISFPKARNYLVQGMLDQFVLFYAVILAARRKRIVVWEKQ